MASIPKPHQKQLDVITSPERYKVLAWGRRCMGPEVLISMADGSQKMIKDVQEGDTVITYNEYGEYAQQKEVLKTYHYGVDVDPKPMVELSLNDKTILSTFDHEYYVNGHWVPAIKLAWGTLAPSEREKFKLLCQQYGTTVDHELQRWLSDESNETGFRQLWVFKNGSGRQDRQDSSLSGGDMASEPAQEAPGEPHQQRPRRQLDRQSGVGDAGREPGTHDEAGQAVAELRGEIGNSETDGKTSHRDTDVQDGTSDYDRYFLSQTISPEVRDEVRRTTGYFEREELDTHSATILPCQPSYDLEVEDNHNYVANGALVHNTGKSVLAGLVTFTEAMKHQGNYYIVAPTERQAKSIYWNDILQLVIPKDVIKKINNVEKTITFHHVTGQITLPTGEKIMVDHDEDKPPSTISLRGVDNPDALRGVKLRGAVLDEYAFMDNAKYVFDTIISPALLDYEGWAIFISSPNGVRNPFYDLVKTAQKDGNDYFYSHATALDNPYVPAREFERIRKRYIEEGKLESFEQEYLAEFKTPGRLVYKAFQSEKHFTQGGHMFNPNELPKEGTHVMGIDFGWIDPFVCLFILIDYDQNWWVYDEVYKTELSPTKALPIIRGKMGENQFSRIIGDAQDKTALATFRELKFYITPSQKGAGSIKGGIAEVQSYFEPREVLDNGKIVLRPKIRFSTAVPNAIKDFDTYSHMIDAYGEPTETPEDKNNHAPDALRYIITDFAKSRKPRERRKKSYDPTTGRLLN